MKLWSILLGLCFFSPVFAHEDGELLLGSTVRKFSFFVLLFVFVLLLLWKLLVTYVTSKVLRKLLGSLLVLLGVCVVVYLVYHTWID
ncbi:MAG: hypothetical protein H6765_00315 [Candidatus Peribacteria bacterium]|nr:MAG: hypothetical protein H6765_00315 [Candidatus Peribacteria bacterium]